MATPTNFSNFPPNRTQAAISTRSTTNATDSNSMIQTLKPLSIPVSSQPQIETRVSFVYPVPASQSQNTHLPPISEDNENSLQSWVREREELVNELRVSIQSVEELNKEINRMFAENQKACEQYEVANRQYSELYSIHRGKRQEIDMHLQRLNECEENSNKLNGMIQAIETQIGQGEIVMRSLGHQVKQLLDANVFFLVCCNRENLAQSGLPPVLFVQQPIQEENQLQINDQAAVLVSSAQPNRESFQNPQSSPQPVPLYLPSNNNREVDGPDTQSRPALFQPQAINLVQDCSALIRETRYTFEKIGELTSRKSKLIEKYNKIIGKTRDLINNLNTLESDLERIKKQEFELGVTLQKRRESVAERQNFLTKQRTTLNGMNGVIRIFNRQLENLMTANTASLICGNREAIANRGVSSEQAQLAAYLMSDQNKQVPVPEISEEALYVPEPPINNHSPRQRQSPRDIVLSTSSREADRTQVRFFDDEKKQIN